MKFEYIYIFLMLIICIYLVYIATKKTDFSKAFTPLHTLERLHVKDVKPGEKIFIEHHRIKGTVGEMKCLSNDSFTKKILLEVEWRNHEEVKCDKYEKFIFDYGAEELQNFHLLNYKSKTEDRIDYHISLIKNELNEAISNEKYETAEKIKTKINNILNPTK